MCDGKTALEAVDAAEAAYDHGRGVWPRMRPGERIAHVKRFCAGLAAKRDEIVDILMWEICKTRGDAEKEVDRTVAYIKDTIAELTKMENQSNGVTVEQGIVAQIKRSPLGLALVCGPFNYPLNEFATLFIPAVIMGNCVVIKTPRIGGMCHIPLMQYYQQCFPPGVVNVIHGSGREVFTPIMTCGKINILAFIGTHQAAQQLHNAHPHPFSVRLALGLDAKNPAVVTGTADLDQAASELTLGAYSYNGQRCTAIKVVFVHKSVADKLVEKFVEKVDALKMGLPWEKGVAITPVAESNKPQYLQEVIQDALQKGARVVNPRGQRFDRSFCAPTLLYPCRSDMRVVQEEQFGPATPIVPYEDVREIEQYLIRTSYGQQASVFSTDSSEVASLVDFLSHHVTRVNINAQCQRGPDSMPFSGRKVSATGTLSLWDALRTMSIRVAVATKQTDPNVNMFSSIMHSGKSNVLSSEVLITKL